MRFRSVFGSLQLPVATLGGLLIVFAVWSIVTIPSPPPQSEGFVFGLAVLVLYVLGWVGFLLLAGGLAIPPRDGYGISFTRYQRGLFILAAIAGLFSAIAPYVLFGLLFTHPSLTGTALLALSGLAVTALIGGLLWRAGQFLWAWRSDRTENT